VQDQVVVLNRIQGVIKKRGFPSQPEPREKIIAGLEIQSDARIKDEPLIDKTRSIPTTQRLLKARPNPCPEYKSILPKINRNFRRRELYGFGLRP
jgi:hypothetical protein